MVGKETVTWSRVSPMSEAEQVFGAIASLRSLALWTLHRPLFTSETELAILCLFIELAETDPRCNSKC